MGELSRRSRRRGSAIECRRLNGDDESIEIATVLFLITGICRRSMGSIDCSEGNKLELSGDSQKVQLLVDALHLQVFKTFRDQSPDRFPVAIMTLIL